MEPILKLEHIQKYYGNEGNITKAIRDISFSVEAGEFLELWEHPAPGKQRCSTVFLPLIQ